MTTTLVLAQGATRSILITGITDSAGEPLTVTGWGVHAVVRAGPGSPVLAEWSHDPTTGQGYAVALGEEITLQIPPAMSHPWTWDVAQLQVEITEPSGEQRVERIADERVRLDRSIIEPNGE